MTGGIEDHPVASNCDGVPFSASGSLVINLDAHRRSADLFMVCLRRSMSGADSVPARVRLDDAAPGLAQGPAWASHAAADRVQTLIERYMVSLRGPSGRVHSPARQDVCRISDPPDRTDTP
jgi:hypothetical protein